MDIINHCLTTSLNENSKQFINDKNFLMKLNRFHHHIYYTKIQLLDFETEKIIANFEGKVISGNMNISASSPTRRTGSLSIVFDDTTKNIAEIDNYISINKKVKIEIGVSNPFNLIEEYAKYGDILWFNQGVFFITQASSSVSTNQVSLSINFIDKMGMLNGVIGGTFPASTSLHELITFDKDGNQTISYPLIKDIIIEMVQHYGNEHYTRIDVSDIPDVGRQIVKWNSETPIWLQFNSSLPNGNFIISGEQPAGDNYQKYVQGEIVGYLETDLSYPGELIMNVGQKVTDALDAIAKQLGNYEYFYDVDGVFHFQKQRNFNATGDTPLNLYSDLKLQQTENESTFESLYNPIYNTDGYYNEFLDNELITQISFNPNYSNIKNDFVCWGSGAKSKSTSSSSNNTSTWVRYHLAIDQRPIDISAPTTIEEKQWKGNNYSLCHKTIYVIKDKDTEEIIRYNDDAIYNSDTEIQELYIDALDNYFPDNKDGWFNWREELYRQALLAWGNSSQGTYYGTELIAEWRKLFDPTNKDFKDDWDIYVNNSKEDNPWLGYNPQLVYAPDKITYWLDLIDTNTNVAKYSIDKIGRRCYANNNTQITEVFKKDVPDIVFIKNELNKTESDNKKILDNIVYYTSIGQDYSLFSPDQWNYLMTVNDLGSCYEDARDALYNNIILNSSVSLTTVPILYMDVNNIVLLNQVDLGIKGSYTINTIGWSIGNLSSMNLSLQEAIVVA